MTSEDLLKDGISKLNMAVENGDLKGIGVARMMKATANSKLRN